jgi:hypothetical protein
MENQHALCSYASMADTVPTVSECVFHSPLPNKRSKGNDILVIVEKVRIEQHSSVGIRWVGGWLFTIGFPHLTLWRGILAIVLWPYYLCATFSSLRRYSTSPFP